ncbi:hypothetical protein GCM10022403_079260 [Streptomyces coacervatus]|uniref:SMI1/KNR4 family protein n=1 Tax=Streptomyces coacervatus TaxID=647381 RepID=A0ABP7J5M3_9ACTN|nr:hypothetical protein [Streptomyces coacervatus]MDF2269319.1 hypothetical protein [Streptomyces coacervatus]
MTQPKSGADLVQLLGRPMRPDSTKELDEVAADWGVRFPSDFVEIASRYGDVVICEYLLLCGGRSLRQYADLMAAAMEESRTVPHRVLPSPGGALLWGNTIEGDQLFLVDRGGGRWTVSAFRRNWHDWYDTDLEFGEWFPRMLAGEIETDWMPEWPTAPYELELVD